MDKTCAGYRISRALGKAQNQDQACDIITKALASGQADKGDLSDALFWTVRENNLMGAACLKRHGADPNISIRGSYYHMLSFFAANGTAQQVAFLLEQGADARKRDNNNKTALDRCLDNREVEEQEALQMVSLLAKKGAIDNNPQNCVPTLHWAALHGRVNFIKKLLQLGTDPNILEGHDTTIDVVLKYAEKPVTPKQLAVVELLYVHGGRATHNGMFNYLTQEQQEKVKQTKVDFDGQKENCSPHEQRYLTRHYSRETRNARSFAELYHQTVRHAVSSFLPGFLPEIVADYHHKRNILELCLLEDFYMQDNAALPEVKSSN